MTGDAPVLTVVVPAFNMERHLGACLASLAVPAPAMELLDVVVVNDGSSDRTGEIARSFARSRPRGVRVVDKSNGNYGSCINAALPVARGEYVKVLDADDTFDAVALGAFLEFLAGLGGMCPDMVFSDYAFVNASGCITGVETIPLEPWRALGVPEILDVPPVMMHGVAYRTQMLRGMGYRQLEGVSYSDIEWSFLPLVGVRRAVRFPRVLYRYLQGREGQTMAAEVLARSWWMRGEVALHMVEMFAEAVDCVRPVYAVALARRLSELVADVYRGCLFGDGRRADGFDLAAFDVRLAEVSPECHAAVAEARYSRRVPYRFVRAWRCGAWHFGAARTLCRAYTGLAGIVRAMLRPKNMCDIMHPTGMIGERT
jgi:hypothetical protein